MSPAEQVPAEIDATRPSTARLYDYYLGGTHNFEIDRQAAEQLRKQLPELADAAWANRGFHGRAAAWMAAGQGIRQFIDIGSGLPTQNNTHEVVHPLVPSARVVYVDVDPLVAAYSAELLAGDERTALVTADLRDPDAVLAHPDVRRLLTRATPQRSTRDPSLSAASGSSAPQQPTKQTLDCESTCGGTSSSPSKKRAMSALERR